MAEEKKIVSKKTEKKSSDTKKASTGAWWKTTVEKPEKDKEVEKPKAKRGRPRKTSSTGTTSKSAPTQKAATRKSSAASKPAPRKTKVTKEVEASVDSAAETPKEAKKPARRGRPRKKPQVSKEPAVQATAPAPKESSADLGNVSHQEVAVDGGANVQVEATSETPKEVKKPARRGRPRKKPQTTEPADGVMAKDKEKGKDAPSDAEADQETSTETKAKVPAEKKKPSRRGRPRKKPKTEQPLVKEGEEAKESEGVEASEETEQKTTKKPRPRRGSRKKKSDEATRGSEKTTEERSADTQDDSSSEDVAAATDMDKSKESSESVEDKSRDTQASKAEEPEEIEEVHPGQRPVLKLLINAEEPEECRLALLEDGRLESIHVATSTRTQTKNNIYKARIVAIEPNLQAAFVDYGTEKNGFLPFSEIHPEYYKENVTDKVQALIDQHQWKKLSISDVVEKGREVLVQVVKEEVGKKGANMTTYLSLPGRCVVLMPGSDSTGISRKISGEERRSKLREYIQGMEIPEGIGWIVRTASVDITKTALSRDVSYLLRLWDDVKKKGQDLNGVGLIYQDHDHVLRFLREHFDPDIQEILVDDKDALDQVKSFVELLPAKQRNVRCKLHRGARPIFNQYSIEDQIESIYQPKVNLPSGGSIVIDPTEALVAIDVNSGSTSKGQNFEETIFQANKEAAKELARQLRLRDLGGLIVIDFIDMRAKRNIREVEREVKTAMKRDKAKVDISRISKFGLMQISRQKLGAPIEAGNYRVCSNCKGRGIVRSVETLALYYLRRIHTAASRKLVIQIECRFPLDVAQYLLNNKRQEIRDLEHRYKTDVVIIADPTYRPADFDLIYHKSEKDNATKKRS